MARRPAKRRDGITRRGFMRGVGVAGGAAVVAAPAVAAGPTPRSRTIGPKRARVTLNVNGKDRSLDIEPRVTLLRALRNQLDVTGPKQVCDRGACGACSVLLDGALVSSCMMLALDAVGRKVVTTEGLMDGERMHPIHEAFCQHDALQCGFCTPGMVMACKSILDKSKSPTLAEVKKGLSGNICRCGTYTRIFEAVQTAARRMGG